MNQRTSSEERNELTLLAYTIMAIAIGIAAGRIAVVTSNEGDTAFLSANDRSRWCTVASLVEDGTYAIDRQIAITDPSGRRRPWSTIDRVQHTGADGLMHDYSSKPPLFSTIVAGVYWVVNRVSGMTLTDQPIYVARIVVALVNLPMLLVMLLAVWRTVIDSYVTDSAKVIALSIAGFGTALLPMTVSLNNHLPAAMATAVTLKIYLGVAGLLQMKHIATSYFVAGLASAFTVANELPAAAMLMAWTLLFFRQHVLATLLLFLPGVLLVAFAFFFTNHIAHQSFRPPYMHRSDGAVIGTLQMEEPSAAEVQAWMKEQAELSGSSDIELLPSSIANRWIVQTKDGNRRFSLVRKPDAAGDLSVGDASKRVWEFRQWDHWYDYPKSYWTTPRKGVDRGEESRLRYLFHTTIGHYGLFSLTPIWILMPIGLVMRIRESQGRYRFLLAVAIVSVSLICYAFYLSRPLIDRNYGGVSSSFRWLLWFTPLWIWGMMPALSKAMTSKILRYFVLAALVASIFSASTALDNPWQHPWIYQYAKFLGWIGD